MGVYVRGGVCVCVYECIKGMTTDVMKLCYISHLNS